VHLKIRVVGIRFAGKERFQLLPRSFIFQFLQRGFGFGDDALILFRFAKLNQRGVVFQLAFDAGNAAQLIFQRGALAHYLLRALGIIPQVGIFGLLVQLGEAHCRGIDVKDASSAVRETA
jgi:hypothetical protein